MAISNDVKFSMDHMCPVAATAALGTALQAAQNDIVTAQTAVNAVEAKVLVASAVAAGEAADARVVTVTLVDADGNALTAAADFWLELISAGDASFAFADGGKGSVVFNNSGADKCLFRTDTAGVAEVSVGDTAAETVVVAIGSGPGTKPIVGTTVSLVFA